MSIGVNRREVNFVAIAAARVCDVVAAKVDVDAVTWQTGASLTLRAIVVKLSNRVHLDWLGSKPVGDPGAGELGVSRPGTLAAAAVTLSSGKPFIAGVGFHAPWGKVRTARLKGDFSVGYEPGQRPCRSSPELRRRS